MPAFFHPHNLFQILIIYGIIAVLAIVVCSGIALIQELQKRKSATSKSKGDMKLVVPQVSKSEHLNLGESKRDNRELQTSKQEIL